MRYEHQTFSSPPLVLRAVAGAEYVLTPEALSFVAQLQARFGLRLHALMVARERRQEQVNRGKLPDYLAETTDIRQGMWQVEGVPQSLQDRRVETIFAPSDRADMIAHLNCGASSAVADFTRLISPSFPNIIAGHINLLDYCNDVLEHQGRRLNAKAAVVMVEPRPVDWDEANILIGGQPVCAALFDFGLYLFHCARSLAATERGPYYVLNSIHNHGEARLWNDIFTYAEDHIGLSRGTIKATVTIDTLTAAFEMDEIIWELRDYICALGCSLPRYMAHYIKLLQNHADYCLPDAGHITRDRAFLMTYMARLIKVCHRRGIHAIGANCRYVFDAALEPEIIRQKAHEVHLGYDGSRTVTIDYLPVIAKVFEQEMRGVHQIRVPRQSYRIEPYMLLEPHKGPFTEENLKQNITAGLKILAGWLSGQGASEVKGRLESNADVDFYCAQIWHWCRHNMPVRRHALAERPLTADWVAELVQAEMGAIIDRIGATAFHRRHYASAARLLLEAVTAKSIDHSVMRSAYNVLNALE